MTYEGIEKELILISSKHSISGTSPRTSGFYYYVVDMKYLSTEGKVMFTFKTTLKLIVKGTEPIKNHKAHTLSGYEHPVEEIEEDDQIRYNLTSLISIFVLAAISYLV